MATFRLTSTHKDADGTVQYQLTKTDQYRQEIIFNSVTYPKGIDWCEKWIGDDDIYQEMNGMNGNNPPNCSQTGKHLKESRKRMRNVDASSI